MSTAEARSPRRVRVERNLYRRPDGKLEVGYRDSASKQRWKGPFDTITAARRQRDALLGARANGDRVAPATRLTFGAAADRWLAEQVTQLRETTQANYRNSIEKHLKPRWAARRMDRISVDDCARLVRELRAEGKAESTIATILRAANRVFKFARRRCGWRGENPLSLLEAGERPRLGDAPERRIYSSDELSQVLAVSAEPWTTLLVIAAVVGGRVSELLGLRWGDLDLTNLDQAPVRFTHQVDRQGRSVELKTEESKATLPLPRGVAEILKEHRIRSAHAGPRAFVFSTRTGRPLSQRNVLRALYRAQARARDPQGRPTFPELFERDAHGELVEDALGAYVPLRVPRTQ